MTDVNLPKEHADLADAGLALLGFASGNMDALAFFNLGQVFPSAMTGNTALLGLALGQGDVIAALRPLIAFGGFLAGAAAAAASVDLWLYKLPAQRGVCWLLAFEVCLLAAFALAWQFSGWPISGVGLYSLIVVASSGMGIQSVAARLVSRPGITTVVFTSTLTSIVTSVTEVMLRPPHRLPFATKRQIGMFLSMASAPPLPVSSPRVGRGGSHSCHSWPLPGRRASTTAPDNTTGVGLERVTTVLPPRPFATSSPCRMRVGTSNFFKSLINSV
jgi:uncharacterized membrane protein YoaK (UPF0700 family)